MVLSATRRAGLPTAIAGLLTALVLGLWVRRRSGTRAGLLAGLILGFSFLFVFTGMTFAADAFLTLAILVASIVLDRACRREDGSDALWGALSGAARRVQWGFIKMKNESTRFGIHREKKSYFSLPANPPNLLL